MPTCTDIIAFKPISMFCMQQLIFCKFFSIFNLGSKIYSEINYAGSVQLPKKLILGTGCLILQIIFLFVQSLYFYQALISCIISYIIMRIASCQNLNAGHQMFPFLHEKNPEHFRHIGNTQMRKKMNNKNQMQTCFQYVKSNLTLSIKKRVLHEEQNQSNNWEKDSLKNRKIKHKQSSQFQTTGNKNQMNCILDTNDKNSKQLAQNKNNFVDLSQSYKLSQNKNDVNLQNSSVKKGNALLNIAQIQNRNMRFMSPDQIQYQQEVATGYYSPQKNSFHKNIQQQKNVQESKNKIWESNRQQRDHINFPNHNFQVEEELKKISFVEESSQKSTRKFKSSAEIIQLHEHSIHKVKQPKGLKYKNELRKISLNVDLIKQSNGQKYQQTGTPNFLIKKQLSLNTNSIQSVPKILPLRSSIKLRVVTENQSQKYVTLFVLRLLANCGGTTAYLVTEKNTGFLFCLKKCEIKSQSNQIDLLIREGKIGSMLDHPLLLKTFCTLYDKQNIYQLIQYMEGKTLFNKSHSQRCNLVKSKKSVKKQQNLVNSAKNQHPEQVTSEQNKLNSMRLILGCLLEGVNFMHGQGLIHRDIKPSNIFISNDYTLKLGDFGSCGTVGLKQYVGTLDYVAPQVLLRKQYNQAVDMWSIGCIAYELCAGIPPFYDKNRQKTMKNIVKGQFDQSKIKNIFLLALITNLLQKDSSRRMSAQDALQHPFFENVSRKKSQ